MSASFNISLSGTKAQAIAQVNEQVSHPQARTALHSLITASAGTRVSISGSMSAADDGKSGALAISGSFWTP